MILSSAKRSASCCWSAITFALSGEGDTLVLNANNALVKYIFENKKSKKIDMFVEQLYDLALIANKPLSPEQMTKFVARSNKIMIELSKQ